MSYELINALMEHLEEEYEDLVSYDKLADKAMEHGHKELAHYLNMIKRDELSHAEYLEMYLKSHDVPLSSKVLDEKKKYNERVM